jgi:hypothetical protein
MTQTTLPRPDFAGTWHRAFSPKKANRKSIAYRIERLRELEAWYINRALRRGLDPRWAEETAHYAQRALTARLIRPVLALCDHPLALEFNTDVLRHHLSECAQINAHWKRIKDL